MTPRKLADDCCPDRKPGAWPEFGPASQEPQPGALLDACDAQLAVNATPLGAVGAGVVGAGVVGAGVVGGRVVKVAVGVGVVGAGAGVVGFGCAVRVTVGVGVALVLGVPVAVTVGLGLAAGWHLFHVPWHARNGPPCTKLRSCDTDANTSPGPAVNMTAVSESRAIGTTNTNGRGALTLCLDACLGRVISRYGIGVPGTRQANP